MTGEIVLRGELRFQVCWTCGLPDWQCRTNTIVVDGRANNTGARRQRHFDQGDSDFDGDGFDGDGKGEGANKDPNDKDTDPYDPTKH